MDAKLTLNIDREIAQKAKLYARSKGRSLSDLVENLLKALVSPEPTEENFVSPKVRSILGSVPLPKEFDYKKELGEGLDEKHRGNE